jgi:hypothetical protein
MGASIRMRPAGRASSGTGPRHRSSTTKAATQSSGLSRTRDGIASSTTIWPFPTTSRHARQACGVEPATASRCSPEYPLV